MCCSNFYFLADSQIESLKEKGKEVRNSLHILRDSLYPIESDFIEQFLELPNELDPRCPLNEHERVLFRFGEKLNVNDKVNHLDYKSVKFTNKFNYYFLDDVAAFDFEFSYKCFDHFLNQNYSPITNADFTKRVLTEAFGSQISKYEKIQEEPIQVNFQQLTGCGSIESFLGYFAKLTTFPSMFPIKLVSMGKSYEKSKSPIDEGVYNANQSNRVQMLICHNSQNSDLIMEEILNNIVDIYKTLNIHFKIVYLPAKDLEASEALCASIQMYSPYYEKYFEIGRISDYKNYISKRMLFNIKENKNIYFGNMIGGTIVNTSRLAMILIENGKELRLKDMVEANDQTMSDFKKIFS